MANNFMLHVRPDLNMSELAERLAGTYRSKGFAVTVANLNNNTSTLVFDKGVGGINMLLGLGLGIRATLQLKNDMLTATYSDADWTGKIIGLAIGWIICFVPFITAIIGSVKQVHLTDKINQDITMLAC